MSTRTWTSATETKRTSAAPARTRTPARAESERRPRTAPGPHELAASRRALMTKCGCGCGGACGGDHERKEGATRNPEQRRDSAIRTVNAEVSEDASTGALIGGILGGPAGALVGAGIGAAVGAVTSATPHCTLDSGPTYSPTGSIPVTNSGGVKSASFSFAAKFKDDTASNRLPKCCEVHQFIKWNKDFHDNNGGPPHSGFPASTSYDTWIEDRDDKDKRYGHRSDAFSDPIASCGDEYLTAGVRDQANGATYCGSDGPSGPDTMKGKYFFQLRVVDVCNGNAVKATSPDITVDWG